MVRRLFGGLIVLVTVLFVYNYFFKTPSFSSGEKAPEFEATLIDGSAFKLSELQGKYVLLDFWGSWCAPCRKDNPKLKSMYAQYANKNFQDAQGFEIVSIALEKSDKLTRRIIEKEGLDWKYHIIDISRIVLMSDYAQLYSVKEVPTKFFINPKGEIMGTNQSFEEMQRILDERSL